MKEHNSNPGMSLLDVTKKTDKNKITSGVNNFLEQKAIKPPSKSIATSSSLKRKAKASKKSDKKPKLSKGEFTL